ncbi:MAG: Eco57I restriction-modification methylase domain-containing protein [Phycisphaerales bacterium]|nr:MAG: Eco57I restriction-modification methylase domain-containing protein [Phycisphaerales bacterium]
MAERFHRNLPDCRSRICAEMQGRCEKDSAGVGVELLKEVEQWRDALARNFALRNRERSARELNFAVQRMIECVTFLRMCEDRGIEPYGRLEGLCRGSSVYKRLGEVLRRAAERYNSSLFCFTPEEGLKSSDGVPPSLELDDEPLKRMLASLYCSERLHEFSTLPPEFLGQVHEQLLGKVIRRTKEREVKIEDKPEVKKAGGIYYTPGAIVDYIVQQTVGKLLEGKTPADVGPDLEPSRKRAVKQNHPPKADREAVPGRRCGPLPDGRGSDRPICIVDPACGAGSFLLGAYRYLLDWHRDWYVNDGPGNHRARIYLDAGGQWRLDVREKKRILLNNIYGVDIEPQAVEVTKLSLLLTVLEGETIGQTSSVLHELVPDLSRNIKCGNSLIGPDVYGDRQMSPLDDNERYRINAFDWHTEFPEVFTPNRAREEAAPCGPLPDGRGSDRGVDTGSGFDVVIGNPPWGQKHVRRDKRLTGYLRKRFQSLAGIFDLFRPFIEQGAGLLRESGYFGMVLPDVVLLKDYQDTRRFILSNLALLSIDWWGKVFKGAVIDTITLVGCKQRVGPDHNVRVSVNDPGNPLVHTIPQQHFWANERYTFNLYLTPRKREVLDSLKPYPRLGDYFEVHEGVHSGNIREALFVDRYTDGSCRELIVGRDEIAPHVLRWRGRHIRLSEVPTGESPGRYANAGRPEWYDREKLLVRRTGDYVLAAVDREHRYASNNFFIVFPKRPCGIDLYGLCALLNAPFITWCFRTIEPRKGRVFAELKIKHLRVFPLPDCDRDSAGCEALNRLGARRSALALAVGNARIPASVHRRCALLDGRIATTVRGLFGLQEDLP